jgi:hypothetical protein
MTVRVSRGRGSVRTGVRGSADAIGRFLLIAPWYNFQPGYWVCKGGKPPQGGAKGAALGPRHLRASGLGRPLFSDFQRELTNREAPRQTASEGDALQTF